MRSQVSAQSHLEYRPSGFHWRRRWPRRVLRYWTPSKKVSLLFSLRSHVLPEAKALAQKLTLLSDIAFAGVTERTMTIAPDILERLLVELCRFLIEAADAVREMAPTRTPDTAAYDLACANAAAETLRQAIATRNREAARNPLREVAARLGIFIDESDPDWQRLAYRALRVMLDAEQENGRRDQGEFGGPSSALQSARALVEAAASAPALPLPSPPIPKAVAPSVASGNLHRADPIITSATSPDPSTRSIVDPVRQPHVAHEDAPPRDVPCAPCPISARCPTIEDGSADYITARSRGLKTFKPNEQANDLAGESWVRNSAPNVRSTTSLFSRILGNRPFDQIGDQELKAAWELVARLPRSYQAKTSKKSPQEAADDADATQKHNADVTRRRLEGQGASPGRIESELLKDRIKRLRTATIYRHMQDFQRICVFLKKHGYLADNLMEDHIWSNAEYERREILEEDNERLTWCGKLTGLFRTPIFQDRLEDVGNPIYWAPLIAVHMGLRSEEVLQLHVDDIQIIDDIPCIVLKQGPGQSLKSAASRRTVPIHENLLKLGFLQVVAGLVRAEEPRLFPWLERSESKKTFTETFSKRFTKYRQDHKVYDEQRDFHSFRTTFNHLLIQAECQDSHRRALMGHVERDIGITNYNPGGFSMATLRNCVNSVVIDISMIRCPFAEASAGSVTDLMSHRVLRDA